MTTQSPKVPRGLGPAGRGYFKAVTDRCEMDPGELVLLTLACRRLDECERLSDALAAADVTTAGSANQERVHPLFEAVAKHTEAVAKLVRQLGATEENTPAVPRSAASARNSEAVSRRWAQEKWRNSQAASA